MPELQVQLCAFGHSKHMQCCWRYDCADPCAAVPADRYVSRLAGMMPDDPWKVALAEQAYFFCEDIFRT